MRMPIITMRVRMDGGHGGDDHDDSHCTGAMKTSVYFICCFWGSTLFWEAEPAASRASWAGSEEDPGRRADADGPIVLCWSRRCEQERDQVTDWIR